MNFSVLQLDESNTAFLEEVRTFCDEYLTEEVYEQQWATGNGFNEGLHMAMAKRGWLTPRWPVDEGGAGLTPLQESLLEGELRHRHAPMITKGQASLVLGAIERWATPEVKAEVLPRVASGEVRLCLGYTEPDGGSDLAAARTRAARDGDEWVIDGQKMFTTGAHDSHYTFLVTRTNPDAPKHKGLTVFLCPMQGLEIRPVHTLGGERTNMVFYDAHRISDRYRLGPIDAGWTVLASALDEEHNIGRSQFGLESRGGMYGHAADMALEVAVEWARTPAPDGNLPMNDPLVRLRLAQAALDVELATITPGPMGRIVSSEALIRVAADLIDLVGPAGLVAHGAPGAIGGGWLEYTHRYAQGTAIYGGSTDIHRNIVAERILGLPRSTPPSKPRQAERFRG